MKDMDQSIVMPCIELNDKCSMENSELVPMSSFVDPEYYSMRTKITCSMWLEKKSENSRRMLARFLR